MLLAIARNDREIERTIMFPLAVSHLPSGRRPLRHSMGALALFFTVLSTAFLVPGRADAATFGEVFVVATAAYDCGAHTVVVWPMTNEPLDGNFSVYSYVQVRDQETGSWTTTDWLLDDGIQGHILYNLRSFDPYAKVTYARYLDGAWAYESDWVEIVPTLDSMGVFCTP
jgi:hypothetical protein